MTEDDSCLRILSPLVTVLGTHKWPHWPPEQDDVKVSSARSQKTGAPNKRVEKAFWVILTITVPYDQEVVTLASKSR